jgi:hypothetical protein
MKLDALCHALGEDTSVSVRRSRLYRFPDSAATKFVVPVLVKAFLAARSASAGGVPAKCMGRRERHFT